MDIQTQINIPDDIAQRTGIAYQDFDGESLAGQTVILLALALTNVRQLSAMCSPESAAKCFMADSNIGAAVAALHLVTRPPTTSAKEPT